MGRGKSIFYQVVRNENSLSELFCNLFRFKKFRSEIMGFIVSKFNLEPDNFEYENFKTQYGIGSGGIPDMSI